jgi:hypothetical protein
MSVTLDQPAAPAGPARSFCAQGGWVVGGDIRVPGDVIDHDVEPLPIRGCNRLRCPSCSAGVRSVVGVGFIREPAQRDLPSLYELADVAASPLLARRGGVRLYLCRCATWEADQGARALDSPSDPDPGYDPRVPWGCSGHALVELPHTFDGVEVTKDNIGALVTRALRGVFPPEVHPEDAQRGFWPARLYTRLARPPWQDAVVSAALAGLEDEDPASRSRALQCLVALQLRAGAERALVLLEGDRTGFAGVREVFTLQPDDRTLEDSLWRLATPLIAQPGRALSLARAEVLCPGKGCFAVYAALASGDPEWLAEHADELARATPAGSTALVDAIRCLLPPHLPKKPLLERVQAVLARHGESR